MGTLIVNHLTQNNYPEFRNGLLDIYFFKLTLGSDCLELFLESCFKNHPDPVKLQKCQLLSNQIFKHNLAHMLSLNLTHKLPFEARFCMFTIKVYYSKSKHL